MFDGACGDPSSASMTALLSTDWVLEIRRAAANTHLGIMYNCWIQDDREATVVPHGREACIWHTLFVESCSQLPRFPLPPRLDRLVQGSSGSFWSDGAAT